MSRLPEQEIQGTLFHFTDKFEYLLGILRDEFKPRFCIEDYGIWAGAQNVVQSWAVPMVCFCDLKLSQIRNHISTYGGYGIGLTKDWGKRNGLSPLIYMTPGSRTAQIFKDIVSSTIERQEYENNQWQPELNTLIEFESFFKPYEGNMDRRGETKWVRFYDEREWRYIPQTSDAQDSSQVPFRLSAERFADEDEKNEANRLIGLHDTLGFDPWDIQYIFVERDEEVVALVGELKKIKEKYGEKEVVLLTTRIMTSDRIALDF